VCSCQEDRDEILEDLFTFAFRLSVPAQPDGRPSTHLAPPPLEADPPEFRVTKLNRSGKPQERVFKITCDSILNLDASKIRSEIGFAGIEGVDPVGSCSLLLRLKGDDLPRRIICRSEAEARHLERLLREGAQRYQRLESDHFQRTLADQASSARDLSI
jgi:hypothetical protein